MYNFGRELISPFALFFFTFVRTQLGVLKLAKIVVLLHLNYDGTSCIHTYRKCANFKMPQIVVYRLSLLTHLAAMAHN